MSVKSATQQGTETEFGLSEAINTDESGAESEGPTVEEAGSGEEGEESETEQVFYEIDGEEVSADDVMSWKKGHMLQADYTKKTQELANLKRNLRTEVTKELSGELTAHINVLKDLISADEKSIDWEELRDTDPSEYLKQKEIQDKRKIALKEATSKASGLSKEERDATAIEEQQKLIEAMPHWKDKSGQLNQSKITEDFGIIGKYAASVGFDNDYLQSMLDHRLYVAMLDAAKYRALQDKKPSITKKVLKTPKVNNQTNSKKSSEKSIEDIFYGT